MLNRRKLNLTTLIENISKSTNLIVKGDLSGHSFRVAFISILISYALGMIKGKRIDLYFASLLHDIGAVEKERNLLFENRERDNCDLQRHAIEGYNILKDIPTFENIALIVKDHHNPNSENLLSRIVYFSDEVDVILRNERILDCSKIRDRMYDSYKDKAGFKDILEAFYEVTKGDAFLMIFYDMDEVRKYLDEYVEKRVVNLDNEEFNKFARALAKSFIDKKSRFTLTHSSDVSYTSGKLAEVFGLSEMDCEVVRTAGFLHDIGKLFVPVDILEYPGKLEENDWFTMKSHVYYTYSFLNQMGLDENIVHIASSHHEFLDGSGYPFGLDKSSLSIGAQIMIVADIYSALRRRRPYRDKAFSHKEAVDLLIDLTNKGKVNREVVRVLEKTEIDIFKN